MAKLDADWLSSTSDMAQRVRVHDWASTPLGPIVRWPMALRMALSTVLDHPLPMVLCWGTDLITLYNDAYGPILGRKPDALGRPLLEVWAEARDTIAPQTERALAGEAVRVEDALFTLERQEQPEEAFFNYTFSPVRDETGAVVGVLNTAFETTQHVLAERRRTAMQDSHREGEERRAYLLKLSDALRPLADPGEIKGQAVQVLGEHLDLRRAFYAELEGGSWLIDKGYEQAPAPRAEGRFSVDAFGGWVLDTFRKGRLLVACDLDADARFEAPERAAYDAFQAHAIVAAPLVKRGELVALLAVHNTAPRAWTDFEVELVRETAERTWAAVERSRAEVRLRESEKRFAQFAASSSDALWVRDAATLAMEYVSPAVEAIYGVRPEVILGDPKHWAALIVPEDRDGALAHIGRARSGEAVTHEFRILRASDGAFRWIRNTDFPLLDEQGQVQRIGGIAEDVTDAKQAAEHQVVLVHELQHRVRNTLAMIRSVADQTGDTAGDVEDYRALLEGRLRALARVQVLLTQADNVGVDLATLIRAEVDAQAAHAGQWTLSGPGLLLSPKAAEVLTLAIHELATNALKYGAFAHAAGRLAVTWRVFYPTDEPWLRLDWVETDAPVPLTPPQREGFGTILIEQRIPYELQGRGSVIVEPKGARCLLEFPLRRAESILETDTVTLSTTIAGGSLDMAGEADLAGCKVLVVEDDFFLAKDTERALKRAGGVVLGPASREEQALVLIADEAPTCALLDINLGEGAQFTVAEALQDRGVPFVFVTGYDDVVIPARFGGVERIRKPTDFRQIVRAAARLCASQTSAQLR